MPTTVDVTISEGVGPRGPAGTGLAGGTTGQVLAKASDADEDLEWVDPDAAGSLPWGSVTGTLADQTDLQSALDGKATSAQGTLADSAVQPGDLGSVATSNDYGDLDNKPTLSTVATSNSYDDLDDLPTLGTAAAAATGDFATAAQGTLADSATQPGDLATVATTGDYADLINKPTLGTAAAAATGDFATAAQGTLADSATQPGDLATVATSGDYDDLSNLPTLGTAAAQASTAFATAAQGALADSALQSETIEVVLTAAGEAIAAAAKAGYFDAPFAGTISAFSIRVDAADEPSAAAIEVDLNRQDPSDGSLASILSAVASIATSANSGTGTLSGTPTCTAGERFYLDIDQGSDSSDLSALITIVPS